MSVRVSIPDGFGRDYRFAVLHRTTTKRAALLAWVLVDEAYTHKTLTIEAGERYLADECRMTRRELNRAAEDLETAGLLERHSEGVGRKARTRWALLLPQPRNGRSTPSTRTAGLPRPFETPETDGGMDGETDGETDGLPRPRSVPDPVLTNSGSWSKDPGPKDSEPNEDDLVFEYAGAHEANGDRPSSFAKLDDARAEVERLRKLTAGSFTPDKRGTCPVCRNPCGGGLKSHFKARHPEHHERYPELLPARDWREGGAP